MPDHQLTWFDATCVVVAVLPTVPEVRGAHFRDQQNPLAGCCLVASQCIYYLTDINRDALSLHYFRYGQLPWQTHYFLRIGDEVLDPTASQFDADTLKRIYNSSVRRAIPATPPRRAQIVLDEVDRERYFRDAV